MVCGQGWVLKRYPTQMVYRRRRSWNLTHSGKQAEQGKPNILPLGRAVARPTDGIVGKGNWKKRRPCCNGKDRDSRFAPCESKQTSSWSFSVRAFEKSLQGGKQMAVMKQLAITSATLESQSLTGAPARVADGWHDIEWRKVTRNVKRLQTRLTKAIH